MTEPTQPLTLTAPTIVSAQRLSRLLTVNSLALAILNDRRAPLPLQAQQPAPNATPRGKPGLTTADYLQAHEAERRAYRAHRDAVQAVLEAERYTPDTVPACLIARLNAEKRHRTAEVDLRVVTATLRADLAPATRPGHLTAYVVKLPTVHYVSPLFGLHALSEPHTATIDTASLEGDDLAYFLEFQREFPARGQWPLYAPDQTEGLRGVRNHLLARPARLLFERLILAHPGSVPTVHPAKALETA
ncbi:hypothetical protein [Deinococcus humi]|uniref:Uncharacterized protein n=1 Tax=Deinococcus humi TaxID=662880 RepID=A0A7W8NE20_9DEIO|nr:hypothetical protein [Deinococcus humi]MBB5361348.1 hypothetical protein [Deinococcus humi]GGO19572.1 hypothetical protein GCM10008949_04110 [Deinococcus humi]